MKKRTQSLVALLLCVLMVATSLMTFTVSVGAEGVATAYGTVPTADANQPFAVFKGESDRTYVGAFDTWPGAIAKAKELMASGEKVTILLLKNHESTSDFTDDNNFAQLTGELLIDLGGNTFTAKGGDFIKMYATEATTMNITVQNGTLLQGTTTSWSDAFILQVANPSVYGGTANIAFENVNFGFADGVSAGHDIFFRGWGAGYGKDAVATTPFVVNTYFKNCAFDSTVFEGKNFEGKTATWFFDAGSDASSIINFTVEGGQFITNGTMLVANANANDTTTFVKNESGSFATFSVPNSSTWQTGFSLNTLEVDTEGNEYKYNLNPKMLVEDGTARDVYTLPVMVTPYGVIPETQTDGDGYTRTKTYEAFAIFMNGEFQNAYGDWKVVWYRADENWESVRNLLRDNPGAEIAIVARASVANAPTMPHEAALGHLAGGNIILDLGGHSLTAGDTNWNAGLFKLGLWNASYDTYLNGATKAKTSLTVKNGTLLQQGYLFYPENDGGSYAETDVLFENVTFGFGANPNSGREYVFRGWEGSVASPSLINVKFKNCTFDSRNFESKAATDSNFNKNVVWFNNRTGTCSTTNYTVEGGQFITSNGKMTVGSIAGYGSLTFVKNESGSFTTFSVPNGSTWQTGVKLNTLEVDSEGKEHRYSLNPTVLVKDGADCDVYTLRTMVTPYGVIPSGKETNTYAIFMNGEFQDAYTDWAVVWYRADESYKSVRNLLRDNPGAKITILVLNTPTSVNPMPTEAALGHLAGGDITVDLGGNSLTATNTDWNAGLIKLGLWGTTYDNYLNGAEKTPVSLTVKNGTLLQQGYLFFAINDGGIVAGDTNVTFENVTFGFGATPNESRDYVFRGWGGSGTTHLTVNTTFKNCAFDSTAFESKNFDGKTATWFHDGGNSTNSTVNYTVDGGQFITDGKVTVVTKDTTDTTTFVNTSGSYATLNVPDGVTLDVWLKTNLGEANFAKLIVDGTDRDVYLLQTYEQIDTQYLVYVEYNGEKLYKDFLIPTGAEYTTKYFNPEDYAGMLTSVKKGSVRLGSPAGLRFATEIDPALLALFDQLLADGDIAGVELGTLVAPADYGFDNDFTIEELKALGRQYLNISAGYGNYFAVDEDENTTHFVGSVVNLYAKSVTLTFRGKGYAKVVLNSGEIVMLYADGHDTSVQSVANTAKYGDGDTTTDYYNGLSDTNKSIIDAFIAGEVPTATEAALNNRNLNGLNVLAIGDSYFQGNTLLPTESWIGQLATRYNWNLTNLGKNGATVSTNGDKFSIVDQLFNGEGYYYGGSAATHTWGNPVEGEAPDLILVQGGFNDWHQNLTLGTVDSEDIDTVFGAWKMIISTLQGMYPNAKIVLVTSWEVPSSRPVGDRAEYADSLQTIYNASYAEEKNIFLVDAGDPAKSGILMTDAAFKAAYTQGGNDDNHLNAEGMEIMADYMSDELKLLFSSVDAQS